ncbi:MAG: prepilin-type N-terminal cleavage/methylation domain-containing protein [Victivallales bacterium]
MKTQGAIVRRGFTLIELLVVIAIIAILAAMLLPALKQAKDSARTSTCSAGNLKQIGSVFIFYADDFNGFFPSFNGPAEWGGSGPYTDFDKGPYWFETLNTLYLNKQIIFQCPSQAGGFVFLPHNLSYGYNYINLGKCRFCGWKKMQSAKNPAGTILAGDSDGSLVWDSMIRKSLYPLGTRHLGKANVLWIDGHVTIEKSAEADAKGSWWSL